MAGEFTKCVRDGQNVWTCQTCNEEIVTQTKPRAHLCRNPSPRATPPPNINISQHQFQYPPPGFSTPQQGFQPMPGQGQQPQTGEVDAMFRFQQFQAEQNKQMMIFFQQQNQEMMKLQQQQNEL